MPSLYEPLVRRMNSNSSRPSNWLNFLIGGIVASPTPTMPISSDSISVMRQPGGKRLDNAAAVIQPAEPPPAMTMLLSLRSSKLTATLTRLLVVSQNDEARSRRLVEHGAVEVTVPHLLDDEVRRHQRLQLLFGEMERHLHLTAADLVVGDETLVLAAHRLQQQHTSRPEHAPHG